MYNTDSVERKVYTTYDYEKFSFIKGNRPVIESHVNNLIKAMRHGKLICPIIVNEDFEIPNGQHRFTAWRRMGEPVSYMVGEGYGLKETQAYHTNSKNWTHEIILNSHCDSGNVHYLRLRAFRKKYGFSIASSFNLLSGNKSMIKGLNLKFKNGDFIATSIKSAESIAEKIHKVAEYCPRAYCRRNFIIAIMKCFQVKGYNHSIFMTRLKHSSHIINDSKTDLKAFSEAIHNVYNTKTHEGNKLELRPL